MFNRGGSNHAQVGFRVCIWGPIGKDRQNKIKNVFVFSFLICSNKGGNRDDLGNVGGFWKPECFWK